MRKSKRITTLLLAAAIFPATTGIVRTTSIGANAAATKTQFFTENLVDEEIDDFSWEKSVEESENISVVQAGNPAYMVAPSPQSVSAIQNTDPITLAEGEYFTAITTLMSFNGNDSHTAVLKLQYTDNSAITEDDSLLIWLDGAMRYSINKSEGSNAKAYWSNNRGGWFSEGNVGFGVPDWGVGWVRGEDGVTATDKSTFRLRAKYGYDGSAEYALADVGGENWLTFLKVDANTNEEHGGFKTVPSGYFTLSVLNNEQPVGFVEQIVTKYDATDNASTVYDEKFTDEETAKVKAVEGYGTGTFGTVKRVISVNNAPENDYLVKKSGIKAPDSLINEKIYSIKTEVILGELTGTAKSCLFFTDSKTSLEKAKKVEFSLEEQGVKVTVDGVISEITLSIGKFYALDVIGKNNNVNEVFIDGVKAGSFEMELAGKFFGYATSGCEGENKANIGVAKVECENFSGEQGDGADIYEDFKDGKYNTENFMFVKSSWEDQNNTKSVSITDAGLNFDKTPMDTIFATQNAYGDFEFVMEVSYLAKEENMDNFIFTFGNDTAEGLGTNGGKVLTYGHDFIPLDAQSGTYAEGYTRWSSHHRFPAGNDETTNLYSLYDFSQGNLIFKFVRIDNILEIYLYPADVADDDIMKTTPFTVIELENVGAGHLGVLIPPTGYTCSMTIRSVSVKNLDSVKADNLKSGAEEARDVITMYDEEISDSPIDDPTLDPSSPENPSNNNTTENQQSKKSGCGSSLTLTGGAVFIVLGAVALLKRKK